MQKTTGGENKTDSFCTEVNGTLTGISGKKVPPTGNSEGPQMTNSNKVSTDTCESSGWKSQVA